MMPGIYMKAMTRAFGRTAASIALLSFAGGPSLAPAAERAERSVNPAAAMAPDTYLDASGGRQTPRLDPLGAGFPANSGAERHYGARNIRPLGMRLAGEMIKVVKEVQGVSGLPVPFPIKVPPGKAPEFSLLKIVGLPKQLELTAGFRFQDAWAVSLNDASRLAIKAPADFDGAFTMEVQFIRGEGLPADVQTVAVEIKPKEEDPAPAPAAAGAKPDQPQAAGTAAPPVTISKDEEKQMMERGKEFLKSGDLESARQVFERMARRGSATSAYAAALTYDPEFLSSQKVIGMDPDVRKAREWYELAAKLGEEEAVKRLQALAKR